MSFSIVSRRLHLAAIHQISEFLLCVLAPLLAITPREDAKAQRQQLVEAETQPHSNLPPKRSAVESSSPFQLVPQHIEIISICGLNQIECRIALSNYDAVANLQRKPNLAIKCQGDLLVSGLEPHFD